MNDFPDTLRGAQPAGAIIGNRVSLDELEREHIMRIVEIAGSMDEAAQILGIDPATLYRKRKRYAEMAEAQAAAPENANVKTSRLPARIFPCCAPK